MPSNTHWLPEIDLRLDAHRKAINLPVEKAMAHIKNMLRPIKRELERWMHFLMNPQAALTRLPSSQRSILFYPEKPNVRSAMFKVCTELGYRMVNKVTSPSDLAIYWEDATRPRSSLPSLTNGVRLMNRGCTDISKQRVGSVFHQVFGYPLDVDPTIHVGPMVDKSDQNAMHDGKIIMGPLPREQVKPDRVYQLLIDTETENGMTTDHRLVFIDGTPVLLYIKHRPVDVRFSNINSQVTLHSDVTLHFSPSELGNLREFTRRIGLEIGEVDVLRSNDGKIYVIDVAKTPFGPPNGLSRAESRRALTLMAHAFSGLVEDVST